VFRVGDKVTQLRNNYDKGAAGVFNGTTGVVTGLSLKLLVVLAGSRRALAAAVRTAAAGRRHTALAHRLQTTP
jgi:ATP-dependent exoDNAse (exonuclease V) alpha subunit